jgi:vancomycin resistance protein YoaR
MPSITALHRALFLILFTCLLAMLVLGSALLVYGSLHATRIYQGVTVLGVPVGGLTREQARAQLGDALGDAFPYVSLYTAQDEWTISLRELGGQFDLDGAVIQAWQLGRSGSFRDDMRLRAQILWHGYDIVPHFSIEPGAALVHLRQVARQAGHPARRAQLWVAGLQAYSDESSSGREMDIVATRGAIEREVRLALGFSDWAPKARIARLLGNVQSLGQAIADPIPVPIAFRELEPPITEVAGARERVEQILSAPLYLRFTFQEFGEDQGQSYALERCWMIDRATLASWLTLQHVAAGDGQAVQVGIDEAKIQAYVQSLASEIARPPREPRFDYDPKTNTLTTMASGQHGYALDVAAARETLVKACFSADRQVTLPVRIVAPRATREQFEALLPLQLISEGVTSYYGSIPERAENIRLATARFYGRVVPAQSTFSFLEHLGLVTTANGYSESFVIYGDRTVLGTGGGVCLVSTTCFRAAFWAGLPIVERHAHSYRVTSYEPPIGLDAAVFSPVVDMKFRNDLDTPILILTEVNEAQTKAYFRFYGKAPERTVRMEGPETSNPIRAGEPVLERDASLAPGSRVLVEAAHDGIDATVYRIIEVNGVVVSRERIFSRFEPWPARYRVGPAVE